MNTNELKQILVNHKHWLDEDIEGWEYMKADLSEVDLTGVDLSRVDLCNADLSFKNFHGSDMSDGIFRDVNFSDSDLSCTDLRNSDLSYAIIHGTNLKYADLRGTNLKGASLVDVDLKGVRLEGANLFGTELRRVKNMPYIPMICPEEGAFVGYKKACDKIVKLLIPEDAKRSSATTRKCRCNKAIVLAIYELDGSISNVIEVPSTRDFNFIYKIHKTVVVDDFDENRWNECSTGIHFFMQRQEAIDYCL